METGKGSSRRSGSNLGKFRIGWERTFARKSFDNENEAWVALSEECLGMWAAENPYEED